MQTNLLSILLAEKNIDDNTIESYASGFSKITRVHTLKDAMDYLSSNRPDVILLNLHLSDTDGLDCLKQIRSFSTSPIIIIAPIDDIPLAEEAMLNGADDYLIKQNITKHVLFRRIRMVVSRRKYLLSRCANGEGRCFNKLKCEQVDAQESMKKMDCLIKKLERLNSKLEAEAMLS